MVLQEHGSGGHPRIHRSNSFCIYNNTTVVLALVDHFYHCQVLSLPFSPRNVARWVLLSLLSRQVPNQLTVLPWFT